MKVLAAMSGGVDSSVAAARAIDAGHEVVGVHLALSRMPGTLRTGARGCCTIEDAMDARRICDLLGIAYYVWDFSERFQVEVVENFKAEYAAGRTPNPCMRCNEKIKFLALMERALALGFDAICTGHYAKVLDGPHGKELHRASDDTKDQSYVLSVLTGEQLEHCIFPLGDTPSKKLVREEAAQRGFVTASKPDSHDICFIPDGDTAGWLAENVGTAPGDIVDTSGEKVGEHQGAHTFTVGQRRGLALGRPAADGQPRFVLGVQPKSRLVVVGKRSELAVGRLSGGRFSWAGTPDVDASSEFECMVQIRAHSAPVEAVAVLDGGELVITPKRALMGVATGQTAAVYRGTRVLGQLTIDTTVRAAELQPALATSA